MGRPARFRSEWTACSRASIGARCSGSGETPRCSRRHSGSFAPPRQPRGCRSAAASTRRSRSTSTTSATGRILAPWSMTPTRSSGSARSGRLGTSPARNASSALIARSSDSWRPPSRVSSSSTTPGAYSASRPPIRTTHRSSRMAMSSATARVASRICSTTWTCAAATRRRQSGISPRTRPSRRSARAPAVGTAPVRSRATRTAALRGPGSATRPRSPTPNGTSSWRPEPSRRTSAPTG